MDFLHLVEGECRLTLTFGIFPSLKFVEKNDANVGRGAVCFLIKPNVAQHVWMGMSHCCCACKDSLLKGGLKRFLGELRVLVPAKQKKKRVVP